MFGFYTVLREMRLNLIPPPPNDTVDAECSWSLDSPAIINESKRMQSISPPVPK